MKLSDPSCYFASLFRSWWWGHIACIPLFTYITYKFGDFGIFGFSKKRVKKEEGGH